MRLIFTPKKSLIAVMLLGVFLIIPLFTPFSARAAPLLRVPTASNLNPINDWESILSWEFVRKHILNVAIRAVLRATLTAITQQTVDWIKGNGGKNIGFVSNFQEALTAEADAAAGEFLQEQILNVNYCGDIRAYLDVALRVNGPYRKQAACALSDIIENVQDHFQYFQQGGWNAFLRVSLRPQNNPNGAFLIALDAKLGAEAKRLDPLKKKLERGPFTGFEVEVEKEECYADEGEEVTCSTTTSKETRTPGELIQTQLDKATTWGIDFGLNAKDFDEAFNAIIVALIGRIIAESTGSGPGFFGEGSQIGYTLQDGTVLTSDTIGQLSEEDFFAIKAGLDTAITNEWFDASAALASLDNTLAQARRDLYQERTANPTSETAREQELENKIAFLEQQKQTLLDLEHELALLKQSAPATSAESEIRRINDRIISIDAQIKSIADSLEITPTPLTATTDIKTNTLNLVQESRDNLNRTITMLTELQNEINRLLLITQESQRAPLTALLTDLQPKIDDLVLTRDELTTIESTIIPAITDAEIIAQTQIAYPTLLQINEKNKDATAFIISVGPVIDTTPPPPDDGGIDTTPGAPPETPLPPPDDGGDGDDGE